MFSQPLKLGVLRPAPMSLAVAALLCAALIGCDRGDKPAKPPARPKAESAAAPKPTAPADATAPASPVLVYNNPARPADLLDDFEGGNHWAVESADDHARLSRSPDHVTEGKQSLRIDYETFGRGKFQVRWDEGFDLRAARAALVDVYLEGGPLKMALGLVVGGEGTFFGSRTVDLHDGWNRGVSFPLTADDFYAGNGAKASAGGGLAYRLGDVRRLTFTFFEGDAPRGSVFLDNLRTEQPARAWVVAEKPTLRQVYASRASAPLYGELELTVHFDGAYTRFFDRDDIDVFATFFSPRGRTRVAHGFLYDAGGDGKPAAWKVRFAPDEVGRWMYDVTVQNRYGESASSLCGLAVSGAGGDRGFIRVSRRDPRCFEYANGDFFYPIGMNVAWASDLDHYFRRLAENGGNTVRIWLCPWHWPLELKTSVGSYDLLVARQIDAAFDLAQSYGLNVQLVLEYHGMLAEAWADNPYNAANGGPCAQPEDFFTNPEARALFKQFLDYICARWGYSPRLFALELWNEVNLARYRSPRDVVDWHRDMLDHLAKTDLYEHLITTSVGQQTFDPDLLSLPGIDFLSGHLYRKDLAAEIDTACDLYMKNLAKPYFLGEFAGLEGPPKADDDPKGVRLSAGLWLSFCSPASGAALPWWWDTHIDRNDLYGRIGALARFAKGQERRGRRLQPVKAVVRVGEEATADVRGLLGPSGGYFYVFDNARILDPALDRRPVIPAAGSFNLTGLLGGEFHVEVWDAREGKRLTEATVTPSNGSLRVALPACPHELAVKVEHVGAVEPAIVP